MVTNDTTFILGNIYCNPLEDLKPTLNIISNTIANIKNEDPEVPIFIGGDFNSRVYDLNQLNEISFTDTNIFAERKTCDETLNSRGRELVEFMEEEFFVLLNGRTVSDSPAQYTYIKGKGKSVIDLVWCNQEALKITENLFVLKEFGLSNHLQVHLSLNLNCNIEREANASNHSEINKIKWKNSLYQRYNAVMSEKLALIPPELDLNQLNHVLSSAITSTAYDLNMFVKTEVNSTKNFWFDWECKEKKKELRRFFRKWSNNNYPAEMADHYRFLKNNYKTFIDNKKLQFDEANIIKLTAAVSNLKNPSEFWSVVRKFKRKPPQPNPILPEVWENYLLNLFSEPNNPPLKNIDIRNVPLLDNHITMKELEISLQKAKCNKAPGVDGIGNEFFKNLPSEGRVILLNIFNKILDEERVPNTWGNISTFMIYKKGDKHEPSNYRSIALINVIVKFFTQILCSRLNNWIKIFDKLPEHQAGFRPERSCNDNIYTLNSVVQIQLSKPKQKVFALFVDFRRAFDGVIHSHLWSKLSALGLSKKFLNILDNLYSNSFFVLKNSTSNPIKIGRGVLQGERLSPVLFSLLLSDIEIFLRSKGCRGIQVNNVIDILLLAYADDIVILTESPHMLLRVLRYLEEYCNQNFLSVNEQKTEIVIFRKKGHKLSKEIPNFYFAGSKLKITDDYCYLGVIFSKTVKFAKQFEKAKSSTNNALGVIQSIAKKLRECSWNSKLKLFDSLLLPILFYGAQTWAIDMPKSMEKIQTNFFKKLLSLPINTPGSAIRLEVDRSPVQFFVLKYALSWTEKILEMPADRYPKICFEKLKALSLTSLSADTPNWFNQIETILNCIEQTDFWRNANLESIKSNKELILEKYKNFLYRNDRDQLLSSKSLQILPNLFLLQQAQNYLSFEISPHKLRIFAQIRLLNIYNSKIITNVVNKFDLTEPFCPICFLPVTENIYHVLCECLKYSDLRTNFFDDDNIDMGMLAAPNAETVLKIVSFVEEAMLMRYQILHS